MQPDRLNCYNFSHKHNMCIMMSYLDMPKKHKKNASQTVKTTPHVNSRRAATLVLGENWQGLSCLSLQEW